MRCRRSAVRVATLEEVAHYGQTLPRGLIPPIGGADGSYPAVVLDDGASGYWRCGDSGPPLVNSLDSTSNLSAGTTSTHYTYNVAGALVGDANGAVALDGTGGFVNTTASIASLSSFTMEAWVKPTSVTTLQYLFTLGPQPNYYMLWTASAGLEGGFFSATAGYEAYVSANGVVTSGSWQHLVIVGAWNGSAVVVSGYRNGVFISSATGSAGTQPAAGTGVAVGCIDATSPTNSVVTGSIDEVAIYASALSASQIATHYAVGQGHRFAQSSTLQATQRAAAR